MENIKPPAEAAMISYIDGETFALFMENMWISDSGTFCHITNNNTSLFQVTKISKSIQSSSGNMPATKRESFTLMFIKPMVLNGSTLCGPLTFAPKLVFMMCEL